MKKNKNRSKSERPKAIEDSTDSVTGEYPVLDVEVINGQGAPAASGVEEIAATEVTGVQEVATLRADDRASNGTQAAFWLTHLETEVSRLHAKWHSIDAEIKVRETRIAKLRDDVKARDTEVERLAEEVRRDAEALRLADERLVGKDAEIAALAGDRDVRDTRIGGLTAELAVAEERNRALRQELEMTRVEIARLDAAVRQEQATAAGLAKYNNDLLADHGALKGKLQDLETYIDGRQQKWTDLNTQVTDYKDALIGMEKALKESGATAAQNDNERARLATRILDLERQCSELAGRRKERETAYEQLQKALTEQFAIAEQLKAEHAVAVREAEQASAKAVSSQRHIESLERGIERRDETLAALGADLDMQKSMVAELSAAKDKLSKRTEELDKGMGERAQQIQHLREELRSGHEHLQLVQQQLTDRASQLAATQSVVEDKTRLVDELTDSLRNKQTEMLDVRRDLEQLEDHAAELGRLRGEALAEAERLKVEVVAQQELIASLESELRSKQVTADFLERNVGRITDLGASLAALDRELGAQHDDHEESQQRSALDSSMVLHMADFTATVASDESRDDDADMLPMEIFMDGDAGTAADVVDIGESNASDAFRKLVALINGEGIDFPLTKTEMTIGRGHGSDIRIPSHFISRTHAKVSTHGIATVIEDAGSKNGIRVNSQRVKRRVLRDGDIVSLGGELDLRFIDAAP